MGLINYGGSMLLTDNTAQYLTPLVIGVTGHRDLVLSEMDELERQIGVLFAELRQKFPHSPLRLVSALAEGGDRLAAKVALQSDVELQAVLPMPIDVYREDFKTRESKAEFDEFCRQAEVLELPAHGDQPLDRHAAAEREIAYANAGMFISAHCHILLALWDGTESQNLGGTAQIIYFQHYDRLPGIAESVPRTSLFLTDDESDLVYHIPCSRQQTLSEHEPATPLLSPCWFTTDPDHPNVKEMPERYIRVFERTDDFNTDVKWYLNRQAAPLSSEIQSPETRNQRAAEQIGRIFGITDALADHFQRRVNVTLLATHGLAILTGLAFILYSEVSDMDPMIFVFLAFLLAGIVLAAAARRRDWHRKYLDYRVLAEGLRVQFYWAIAGIHGEGQTKFAYDNFMRQRDMELGWIRNIMRVVGTLGDSQPNSHDAAGLQFTMDNWIGDDSRNGQLSYYKAKAAQRARINRITDRLSFLCLWTGILIASLLAFFLDGIVDNTRETLIVLMGVLPMIAAVTEAYTQRKANRELTKQYQFMEHVFGNARRRLDESSNGLERREILQGLGDAALTEHAEWILIHRDRKPESGGF